MAENSKIQWTDHTFNPWIGCTKVSPGCANCYAAVSTRARVLRSQGHETWGKGEKRSRTSAANWKLPVRWNLAAACCPDCGLENECVCGRPRPRVFCASLADIFDLEAPIKWLADLFCLIRITPYLDWLCLTKRPENALSRMAALAEFREIGSEQFVWELNWLNNKPPENVWIGTTVEDQKRADERIPKLLEIPAAVRFLSVEPMLGEIRFPKIKRIKHRCIGPRCSFNYSPSDCEHCHGSGWMWSGGGIHWAIFGGESGPGARPCHIEWIRDGVRQCREAGVAPFVKQLGALAKADCCTCGRNTSGSWVGPSVCWNCDGVLRLKDKKGGDMAEWPEDLRVREFPEVAR